MSVYRPGIVRNWKTVLALSAAFLAWVFWTPGVEALLRAVFPDADELVYTRSPMWTFVLEHLRLVALAGGLATAIGLVAGLTVVSPWGRPFRGVLMRVAGFGQSIPSVALMAIAVPAIGYGSRPVLLALIVYSILPVMANVVAGVESVPPEVVEAGRGMGMTRAERLWHIEVPIAMPVIMNGVRMMLVIVVSAATMGAVVGAGGLGVPILSGIGAFNNAVVAYGSVPAILLALIVDQTL